MLSPVSLPLVTSPSHPPSLRTRQAVSLSAAPDGKEPRVSSPPGPDMQLQMWRAKLLRPAGLSCVWKCQKFDGLRANEAKLGWSLCMPSTMLTRVLTPDPVTTMSELNFVPPPPHYGLSLLLINMLGTRHNLVFTQCSRQCLKQHPSYLKISLYGCRKESLNECETTWAPTNTTPRFCLCPV